MEDALGAAHRRDQALRIADVAAVHFDAALLEPPHVLAGQGDHTQAIAPLDELGDQVASEKTSSAGDENVHGLLLFNG